MLVVMQAHATEEQVKAVCQKIEALGFKPHSIPGAQRVAIGITGNQGAIDSGTLEEMAGVGEVIRVSKPYKLVSRDLKPDDTIVRFPALRSRTGHDAEASIGGAELAVVAGPCAIESRGQAFAAAQRVRQSGA